MNNRSNLFDIYVIVVWYCNSNRYMVGLHLLNVGSPFNPVLIRDTCNEGLNSGVNKYIHRIGTRNWDLTII